MRAVLNVPRGGQHQRGGQRKPAGWSTRTRIRNCGLLITVFIVLGFFFGGHFLADPSSESRVHEVLFMMWTSVMCAVLSLSLSWERQRMTTRVHQLIELTCCESDCPA